MIMLTKHVAIPQVTFESVLISILKSTGRIPVQGQQMVLHGLLYQKMKFVSSSILA